MEYHLLYFPPNSTWSNGGWSIYKISSDELARRVKYDEKGRVVERHPWPGFLGCVATLKDVDALISRDMRDGQ